MTLVYLFIFFTMCFFVLKLFIKSQRIVREFGIIGTKDLEKQEKRNRQLAVILGKMALVMAIAMTLIILIAYVYSCMTGHCRSSDK